MALPKPDPTKYRGGSTSRLYQEDLQAWQDSQEPTVEPVGQEEVVSLASTFDEEDSFAPEPIVPDMDSGSGFRETGDTTTTSDPFADYTRASREGSEFIATYSDDPEGYADVLAGSDLPYMDYTDEMLQDVRFQTPEPGQYENFGGRLISGETEEYERAFVYNEMLNRGLDEQTARTWYDSGDDAVTAYDLIAQNHNAKQDNYLEAMSGLLESDNKSEFTKRYNESDFRGKIAVANMLREQGTISDEKFEQIYVNEWNASQEGKARPTYIVKAKAPKPPLDPDQEHQWDFGEEVYTYYQPNEPWSLPDETMSVIDPKSFVPPGEDASDLQVMQYYDYMSPASSQTRPSSEWVQFRDEFLLPGARTALAMATGGTSEQLYSAVKLATGEELTGSDWANLAIGGLELTGVINPGTVTIDPSTGQEILTGGQGLFGLDYDTTVGIIKGAGSQDPVQLVTSLLPSDTLSDTLKNLGIPPDLANDPDFIKGVSKGLETVVEGGNLRDGLESGLTEYITEGGGFGGLPDIDIDFDLSGLEEALQPIADTFGTVADVVQKATEPFVDVIDEGIDVFGEKVVDPALQAAEDFVESIPTPELPEYLGEFPDLNLPNINLGLNVQMPQLSATRTTDSLFSDELFKFKTEIGLTPTGPLLKPQERKAGQTPEQRQQRKEEEVVDLFSRDPFASPFDRNIV